MPTNDFKVQFKTKQLSALQTVAEILVHARGEQRGDLAAIAAELQISSFYLEALEQGDYQRLPCKIYCLNFLKKYGAYLKLDVNNLLNLFDQEWSLFHKTQPTLPQMTGVSTVHLWKMPRWLRWSGASFVILAIMSYLGFELYNLRLAPTLVIETPQAELMLDKQIIQVKGSTDPEAALTINDQTIVSDIDGNFSEMVSLRPGLNIVEIKAKKKYSREHTLYRKIIVNDQTQFSENDSSEAPLS